MADTFAPLSPRRLLELLPQQVPFRFVDEVVEVSETHIVGRYTFKNDEFFHNASKDVGREIPWIEISIYRRGLCDVVLHLEKF